MNYKSFNEFWGEFLQVTFHLENPDRWPSRERKADWALSHLNLKNGSHILDLGCGDGLLDIWLSRKGMRVTAVDRNTRVIELARESDDTGQVEFLSNDLRQLQFDSSKLDAVLFIETLGLMNKSDETALLKNIYRWLKPDSKLIIDCPAKVELENSWTKKFASGIVSGKSSFDPTTHLQKIDFHFTSNSGESFGLMDSADLQKNHGPGIVRSIYPKEELVKLLESIGFKVSEVAHYYKENYFSFVCIK